MSYIPGTVPCARVTESGINTLFPRTNPCILQLEPLSDEKGIRPTVRTADWHEHDITVEGSAFDVGPAKYYDMIYDHLVKGRNGHPAWQAMQQIAIAEQVRQDNPLPVLY